LSLLVLTFSNTLSSYFGYLCIYDL